MLLQVTYSVEYFIAFIAPKLSHVVAQGVVVRALTALGAVALLLDLGSGVGDLLGENTIEAVLRHRRVRGYVVEAVLRHVAGRRHVVAVLQRLGVVLGVVLLAGVLLLVGRARVLLGLEAVQAVLRGEGVVGGGRRGHGSRGLECVGVGVAGAGVGVVTLAGVEVLYFIARGRLLLLRTAHSRAERREPVFMRGRGGGEVAGGRHRGHEAGAGRGRQLTEAAEGRVWVRGRVPGGGVGRGVRLRGAGARNRGRGH